MGSILGVALAEKTSRRGADGHVRPPYQISLDEFVREVTSRSTTVPSDALSPAPPRQGAGLSKVRPSVVELNRALVDFTDPHRDVALQNRGTAFLNVHATEFVELIHAKIFEYIGESEKPLIIHLCAKLDRSLLKKLLTESHYESENVRVRVARDTIAWEFHYRDGRRFEHGSLDTTGFSGGGFRWHDDMDDDMDKDLTNRELCMLKNYWLDDKACNITSTSAEA